ncbi:flagellin [Priestia flexa]|uniref:flagellin N-terminal helical domain-containing protein n=1 Tax=Priestia flexa TaxID=86664 RepID=UPI0024BFEBDD|nr:flagellin [Priestia flexa]WHX78941.1 flagellin [Priestia flexa]
MRINHNIAALNTYRQLGSANNAQQSSMEKLSSGLRINSAKDDAAGLAISEKMRGQVRGLDMAAKNAQDGVSLLQTAEGALNETHDILQRMRELAVQSSNDTNTETDRDELQKEVDQLAKEITRIAENTEFNTKKLINGAADSDEGGAAFTFHIGANTGQSLSVSIKSMTADALGVSGTPAVDEGGEPEAPATVSGTYTAATELEESQTPNSLGNGTYTIREDGLGGYELVDDGDAVVASSADGITFTGAGEDTDGNATPEAGVVATETLVLESAVTSGTLTIDGTTVTATPTPEAPEAPVEEGGEETPAAGSVGTSETVTGIDISSSQGAANTAIDVINQAIEDVSAERSKIGAYQNRLEHSINNLSTSSENLTAAESRIRDVDYALAA